MYKKNGIKLSLITIALLSSVNAYAANTINDQTGTSTVNNSDNTYVSGPNNTVIDSLNLSVVGPNNNVNGLQDGSVSGYGNTFDGSSQLGGMQRSTVGGTFNNVASDNSTVGGSSNNVNGADNTVYGVGNNVGGTNLYSIGRGNTVNGDNSGVIGNNSTVNAIGSVAIGDNLNTTRNNVLDVGGKQVANVGDAVEQGDAVNLRQLQQGLASVQGGGSAYDDSNIRSDLAKTNGRVDRLERQVDKVERKLSQGIASVAAMQNAPLVQGKTTLAVGGATYNGESAIGASVTKSISNNFAITGGIAVSTGGSPVIRIGGVWTFD
ncbi:YadA-like family protein [Methylovorus glucosotrophus]|uniref:YadA domain protein n=1 Tax=Methylovorus glucosotrophus (strain SIP3-4) TaxID=582744 RepID=C6X7T8_METGS|nr:YadA-like family protein [Methylovorus glucosotrophus]ACT51265.1 YadA domain protein [Methylovorus glucosotrophus SIP3-4]